MIGAKLDGEAQRKKLISTRHPKQAATQSCFWRMPEQKGGKSSSKQQRDPSWCWLKQEDGKAQASSNTIHLGAG